MPRSLALVGLCWSLLTLLGCQQASTPLAPANSGLAPAPRAPEYALNAGDESFVAMFHVSVDLESLSAEVSPVRGAAAQPPQAIYYDLDIQQFLKPSTFKVYAVEILDEERVRLYFSHQHPFAAPIFANPITGLNRADLGYTGRVLVLAEGNTHSFFEGVVTLNPEKILNADGYVQPGDLLAGGSINNTLPYKLLIDEALDNRYGISNGGNPQGNYDPLVGGWQRGNIGANGNGWTGFDYIHGGQQTASTLIVKAGASSPNFDMYVALLIKYTDPRGQGGRNLRFPPETTDVTQFAYRLPFAALDAGKIEATTVDFGDFAGSARTLHLYVRDWDNTAGASTDADLSDEPNVSLIQPGAGDQPLVSVDMPDVNSVPYSPSSNPGSGLPGDEIDYAINVFNSLNPGPGDYFACARAVDPENALDRAAYHFGVDPYTILPTRTPISLVTYQVIPYTIGGSIPEVRSVSPEGALGLPGTSVSFTANASGAASYAWDFGEGAFPSESTVAAPTVVLDEPGLHYGTVVVSNVRGASAPFAFAYEVAQPAPPVLASHQVLIDPILSPVLFEFAGRPALIYVEDDPAWPVFYARAAVASPSSSADWSIHQLPLAINFQTIDLGNVVDATVHSGRVCVVDSSNQIAVATVAEPTETGHWQAFDYRSATGPAGINPSITVQGSTLAIAYFDKGPLAPDDRNDVGFSYATALPNDLGDFTQEVAIDFGSGNNTWLVGGLDLIPYTSGYALSFWFLADDNALAMMAHTSQSQPILGEWVSPLIFAVNGITQRPRTAILAEPGDRLVVAFERAFEGVFLHRWADPFPGGSTPATQLMVLDQLNYAALADLSLLWSGNRLLVGVTTFDQIIDVVEPSFFRATRTNPAGPADFLAQPLPVGSGPSSPVVPQPYGAAALIAGTPAYVYYDAFDGALVYASATGPW